MRYSRAPLPSLYFIYKWTILDYATHGPHAIAFVPPARVSAMLRDDYRQMQEGFIYAGAPSFGEIMERLQELQDRFRELEWDK